MKLVTIVGARPQFVKAGAVSRSLARSPTLTEVLVHTGQHFDHSMSKIFFDELQIPIPAYNLGIANLGHGAMTGRMLESIEKVLIGERPDMVMVYGDTNSTLAGALAAKKLGIRVAHVEAGLRSHNMAMPEEINRVLTDRISDLLFCPTQEAVANLKREGFEHGHGEIIASGDVMYDAALFYAADTAQTERVESRAPERYVLCTLHRASNTDNPANLRAIIGALEEIHKEIPVIFPIHPRTRAALQRNEITPTLDLVDPVGYREMIQLVQGSQVVMTDSGGLQKEAYFFRKQCVTLREETEWSELVDQGWNRLAGADASSILRCYRNAATAADTPWVDLYGGGQASDRIARRFEEEG